MPRKKIELETNASELVENTFRDVQLRIDGTSESVPAIQGPSTPPALPG